MATSKAVLALRDKAVELKKGLDAARTLLLMFYDGQTPDPEIPVSKLEDYMAFARPVIDEVNKDRIARLIKAGLLDILEQQQQEKSRIEKAFCEEMVEIWRRVREFGIDVCKPLGVPVGFEEFWRGGEEELENSRNGM